ncbi:hypothetical protein [Haloferax sp. Atlit-12N]|uniref:hypothetical protein n=1 Tax=Haloferax sp. Atlit-12N TaxID=2077203 RepID=UPI0011E5EE28|nr:hypothetical protein [Haloferax sp. Atlit-12N]
MVLLASTAAPVSATPPGTTEADGETKTVIATPGQSGDRGSERSTDVTGEIILGEDRDMVMPEVSVTITITTQLPGTVSDSARSSIDINTPKGEISVVKTKR